MLCSVGSCVLWVGAKYKQKNWFMHFILKYLTFCFGWTDVTFVNYYHLRVGQEEFVWGHLVYLNLTENRLS